MSEQAARLSGPRARALTAAAAIALCVALLIALAPFARSGYFFDDMHNSLFRGAALREGVSMGELLWRTNLDWMRAGRFFPGALFSVYAIHLPGDSLAAYRTIHLSFVLLDLAVLAGLMRQLGIGRGAIALASACLVVVLQFNPRWDGVTSFGPLAQVTALWVLASWWAAWRYLTGRGSSSFFWMIVFLLLGLLTYEVALAALAGIACMLWVLRAERGPRWWHCALVVLGVCALFMSSRALLALLQTERYGGTVVGNLAGYVPTYLAQFVSAFPMTSMANRLAVTTEYVPSVAVVATLWLCFSVLLWRAARPDGPHAEPDATGTGFGRREGARAACLLSLMLMAVPPLLIAASARYQSEVLLGDPHISVYLQELGLLLMLSLLFAALPRWSSALGGPVARSGMLLGVALVLAVVGACSVAANEKKIGNKNQTFKAPRQAMEIFVRSTSGLAPDADEWLVRSPYPWESSSEGALCSNFFSHHLRRPITCRDLSRPDTQKVALDRLAHAVLLERLPAGPDARPRLRYTAHDVSRVFAFDGGARPPVWTELSSGAVDWFEIFAPAIRSGYYGWESSGREIWAWTGSEHSELILRNVQKVPQAVVLSLRLDAVVSQRVEIALEGQAVRTLRFDAPGSQDISVPLMLPAGQSVLSFESSGRTAKLGSDPRPFRFRIAGVSVRSQP